MLTEQKIIGKAALIKGAMQSRSVKIKSLSNLIGLKIAGMANDISKDRFETIQMEFNNAAERQRVDGIKLAVLRYVLGCTDDIDPDNLELDR